MFRSLDHPQGATLFLAKVTSKTFIKFHILLNHISAFVFSNFSLVLL